MTLRVLGLIPARGGSKGVVRKNLRPVAGRPLLAYTADAALAAQSLARVVLSTEDAEIAAIGRSLGLEVIDRPPHLAADDAPTMPVVEHALDVLAQAGEQFDAVCLLQPTCPLREPDDIDAAVKTLDDTGADSVISFAEVGANHPAKMKYVDGDGRVSDPPYAEAVEGTRRQDLPKVLVKEGSIYLTRTSVIRQQHSFQGNDCRALVMPPDRVCNIDSEIELYLAECLLTRKRTDLA